MSEAEERTPTDEWAQVEGGGATEETFEIVDIELAEHVTHPTRGRLLRRLRDPHSAAELAESLDVPVTRLYHHIKQLEAAGLIRVVATRRVGAATERRYQSSAKSFTIPEETIERAEPEQLAGVLGSLFDLAKLELVEFVERGGMSMPALDEQLTIGLMQLRLTPQRRRELVAQLAALLEEFADDSDAEHSDADSRAPFAVFLAALPPEGDALDGPAA
jgi:DNA-binding transcriptional ArsR family regulator